jgi:AcrR family transcriptional regulator
MYPHNTVMDDAIERIYQALLRRELDDADLSARRIASFLDRTTGAVYHRWGSIDGLLFAVSQRGFVDLGARLTAAWSKAESLVDCAVAYVEFGLENPELYPLMFERRFDWAALRAAGAFEKSTPGSGLLGGVVCLLEEAGSKTALADTRLLMAGLHGIVSFAASGRMNAGDLRTTDRDVALAAARDLATRLTPVGKKKKR